MKKTITYEEFVQIKNLLTYIKSKSKLIDVTQSEIHDTVDKINEILNKMSDE